MNVVITGRKITPKPSFKEKVDKKLTKLDRFFHNEAQAYVTVSLESKDLLTVEVTIKYNGLIFRSEKTTDDMVVSLESAVDSIVRQINRNKSKLRNEFKDLKLEFDFDEDFAAIPDDTFEVVKTKRFAVKPMNVDEAILQMNLLGHQFYMFSNSTTQSINVIYRRKDGNYGLLEPDLE